MHRKKIEDLLGKVKVWVEEDSSSLTRDDQDRIAYLLKEVQEAIGEIYDEREGRKS